MGTLADLQAAHKTWLAHNFPEQTPHQALLGVGEEVGELMHAHLKLEQRIRGDRSLHLDEARDAIGDIIIYLASYCNSNGFDLELCLNAAWAEVKSRDWQANAEDGKAGEFTVSAPTCICGELFISKDCAVHGNLRMRGNTIEHDHES